MVRVRVSNGERESNDNGDDDDIDDDLELHSRTTKSETRDEEAQLENAPKEGTLKAFSIESKPLFTLPLRFAFASPASHHQEFKSPPRPWLIAGQPTNADEESSLVRHHQPGSLNHTASFRLPCSSVGTW